MKRTLVLSVLVLSLALGVAWSGTGSTPSEQQLRDMEARIFGPAAGSVPAAACTVSCLTDPNITCTSQSGNCSRGGFWGVYWITCDGVRTMCPEF